MAYDPISGEWRNDSTGLPDLGMPAGMGDFAGGIVPATQQTPTAPQQINPRPMLGGPQAAPAFTPSAVDVTGNPLQAPPVPLPVTDPRVGQQIQRGFQQLDQPSMSPGGLVGKILQAPFTVPVGIIEELRGLMGGDTIEGWAQEARSRYGDPNFTESRAFGVQGPAEEPTFGDRFLGVVTGSAQRGAMAGKTIRQQIGAYNANRKAVLRENKDVQQLNLGDINLQTERFKAEHQPELFSSQMDARRAATRASTLSGNLSQYTLTKKQEDAATVAQLAQALAADPSLADGQHTSALMALAKGNLNLVKQALEVTAAGRTMPDVTGVTPGQKFPVLAGQAGDIAKTYSDVAGTDEQRAYAASLLAAENARKDAEEQRKAAAAAGVRAGTLEQALAKEARERVQGFYDARIKALQPTTWFNQDEDVLKQRQDLIEQQALVQGFLQSGAMPREDAYAIASGNYDALATPLAEPSPTASPTPTATPSPLATARPESPADVRARVLRDEMSKLGVGVRPTPMATPSPTASRTGEMSEDARRKNAQDVMDFKREFDEAFRAKRPNDLKRGPGSFYQSELERNARDHNLVLEQLR
jgi:hypothetical protein